MNRRDFLGRTLGAAASFAIQPFAAYQKSGERGEREERDQRQHKSSRPTFEFPEEFVWGATSAAYAVEGAWNQDGKGESIWDRYAHSGKVKGGATGDVASDSYHLYKEDIAVMKQMNLKSYRFSISWPRIQPKGSGAPNAKGLDHYKRLADALHDADIRPFGTLYNWDLPQALEDAGGWPNRDLAGRFTDYAEATVRALGDRVSQWCMFDEPWKFTFLGYGRGTLPPGRANFADGLRATHVVNLAQGQAFRAMKALNSKLEIGSAFGMSYFQPATSSEADRRAADRAHALGNVWFAHPAMRGEYPAAFPGPDPLELMGVKSGDMDLCRAPLDFMGISYDRRQLVSAIPPGDGETSTGANLSAGHEGPLTDDGSEVSPAGLYEVVMRNSHEYKGTPIEITGNGCSYMDSPAADNHVHDERRIEFLRQHLKELGRSMLHSANVRSYHYRSLLDGFEWEQGYSQRYGLVFVDFKSLKRTVKDSGAWLAKLVDTSELNY